MPHRRRRALAVLDAWEDDAADEEPGSEDVRRRVRLLEPDLEAWAYEFNRAPSELPVIAAGDWLGHVARGGVPPTGGRTGVDGSRVLARGRRGRRRG